jgi:hypothetical protein
MRKPSPAMIVAVLALVVAMGGTAIAAKHYLITSLGQIAPKVRGKLAGVPGPQGPVGAKGATGASGPRGAAGVDGHNGINGTDGTNGTDGVDGSARAYAHLNSAGGLIVGQDKNVESWERKSAGNYCVGFGGGITPENSVIMALPEYGHTASNKVFLQATTGIVDECAADQFSIQAHDAAGNLVDSAFMAMVP